MRYDITTSRQNDSQRFVTTSTHPDHRRSITTKPTIEPHDTDSTIPSPKLPELVVLLDFQIKLPTSAASRRCSLVVHYRNFCFFKTGFNYIRGWTKEVPDVITKSKIRINLFSTKTTEINRTTNPLSTIWKIQTHPPQPLCSLQSQPRSWEASTRSRSPVSLRNAIATR